MDVDSIDDIETLRVVARSYQASWRQAEQRLERLEARLQKLEGSQQLQLQHEIDELKRQLSNRDRLIFGAHSERRRRDADKEKLAKDAEGHGPTEQPELESLKRVHELDDADRICPSCGGQLQPWAGQSEDSEEVDVIERRVLLVKHRRQKYRATAAAAWRRRRGRRS